MVGKDASLAIERGLPEATWYVSLVSKATMRELLQRRNGPAIRDTRPWFALIIGLCWAGCQLWQAASWWAALPFMLCGVLYASTSDSRWHESDTSQVCDCDSNAKMLLDKFEIAENVTVSTTGTTYRMAKAIPFRGFTDLSGTKEKPVDLAREGVLARGSYLRWRAWLQKEMLSFKTIPFEQIGLRKSEYRGTLLAR